MIGIVADQTVRKETWQASIEFNSEAIRLRYMNFMIHSTTGAFNPLGLIFGV